MAKLIRPTEAYIEAEVWSTPGGVHGTVTSSTHKFQLEGGKIYLPNLGSNPRGVRHYVTYDELCQIVDAYEKYDGIGEKA